MAGRGIRLYTDEDVDPDLARELSRDGYDVLSCVEAGNHNQKFDDEWQLRFAVEHQRAILSHNYRDFTLLDRTWRESGLEHFGIILSVNGTPIDELVRRTRTTLRRSNRSIIGTR